MVFDAQPSAHGPHMRRGGPQVVPWQVWEQVVFNLVLQPTVKPVHPLWTAHIVGGHHLLSPQNALLRAALYKKSAQCQVM